MGTPDDVLVRVRQALPTLRPSERQLGEAALADAGAVADLTITGLAGRCNVSTATVTRFCRTLGFDGYTSFRLALARAAAGESGRRIEFGVTDGDIDPSDSPAEVLKKLAYEEARAVQETADLLDIKQLERAVAAIDSAPVVDVYGVAGSGLAAQDLQQKLLRIGRQANAWSDAHLALTSAAVLPSNAVAIGFSHSGETVEVAAALEAAGGRGATTIAVTNYPDSPLAHTADIVLTTVSRETRYRYGAMSSRMAQLTVVDALFIAVAQLQPDEVNDALSATLEAVGHRHDLPRSER